VGLVPRIYDATAGEVLVDGINVRECNLRDVRANVALVSQDVLLFNDSIRNNIAFGVNKPDPKSVEAAAKAAYVDEFAKDLGRCVAAVPGRITSTVALKNGDSIRLGSLQLTFLTRPLRETTRTEIVRNPA